MEGREKMATTIKEISRDTIIGDVLELHPGAVKVIEKYFGSGCFTCPGIKMESIALGATMHGLDPKAIVNELKQLEAE
jgi:hybrid cluster-associated redox disulfide protein